MKLEDRFNFKISDKKISFIYYLLAVIIGLLNIIRIFNISYCGDEAFSIKLAQMTIPNMIQQTAADVHPPLYYIFIRAGYLLLGNNGYAYHLVSIIPVLSMIVFSLTIIRKKYGKIVSILFIVLETFMGSCFTYNLQVRMYSWANFLVFLCFWFGIEILEGRGIQKNWIFFTLSGILAAYTHYYALISVAFIYITVYLVIVLENKKNFWKCILSGFVCIISYLPWLGILMASFRRTSSSWWSTEIPTFQECIGFMIGTDILSKLIVVLFVISIVVFIKKMNAIYKPMLISDAIRIDTKALKKIIQTDEIINMFLVIISIMGTVCVGIGLSKIFRPLFLSRYTFVLVGALGLCICIFIGKAFQNCKVAIIIILLIFLSGSYVWFQSYRMERGVNDATIDSVQDIQALYENGDRVVCNINPLDWTVLDYYFDFKHDTYNGFSKEYVGNTTWLIYNGALEKDFVSQIESNEGRIDLINSGKIANYGYDLYKVSFEKNTD